MLCKSIKIVTRSWCWFLQFFKKAKSSISNKATKRFHDISICAFYEIPVLHIRSTTTKEIEEVFLCITHYWLSGRYVVWNDIERSSKWGSHLSGQFSVSWNTAKNAWSSYHARKKNGYQPLHPRIVVPFFHYYKMSYIHVEHATSSNKTLYWTYKDLECTKTSPSDISRLFGSTNICSSSNIIQWIYPEFAFPKCFALFGALHTENKLLIANEHLLAGIWLDEILFDISIGTAGLQTVAVDVNHV